MVGGEGGISKSCFLPRGGVSKLWFLSRRYSREGRDFCPGVIQVKVVISTKALSYSSRGFCKEGGSFKASDHKGKIKTFHLHFLIFIFNFPSLSLTLLSFLKSA